MLTAAVADRGVILTAAKQLMARPHLALYCARAQAADGLIVTICEYPNAAQALRGEIASRPTLGESSRVRNKSVLHWVRRSTVPDAEIATLCSAFETLPIGDAGT
jgi:hypothetical protein